MTRCLVTCRGWRERLVDVATGESGGAASASDNDGHDDVGSKEGSDDAAEDFRLVLAPGITPALSAMLVAMERGLAGDPGAYTSQQMAPPDESKHAEQSCTSCGRIEYRPPAKLFTLSRSTPPAARPSDLHDDLDDDWDTDSDDDDMVEYDAEGRVIKKSDHAAAGSLAERHMEAAPVGTVLEFSPACNAFAYELSQKLTVGGGGTLRVRVVC